MIMGLLFDNIEELLINFSKKDYSPRKDLIKRMDASGIIIRQRIEAITDELRKAKELLDNESFGVYEKNVWEVIKSVYTIQGAFMDKRSLRYKLSHSPGSSWYDPYYGMDDEEASQAMEQKRKNSRKLRY